MSLNLNGYASPKSSLGRASFHESERLGFESRWGTMNKLLFLLVLFITTSSVTPVADNTEYNGGKLPTIYVPALRFNPPTKLDGSVEACAAYHNDYFNYIAKRTPFSKEHIAGYFGLETGNGTSRLWRKHMNPSGVVSTRNNPHEDGTTWSSDDGGSTKASFHSVRNSAEGWIHVFNLDLYKPCRDLTSVEETCKCFKRKNYHTSPRWWTRVTAIENYSKAFRKLKI